MRRSIWENDTWTTSVRSKRRFKEDCRRKKTTSSMSGRFFKITWQTSNDVYELFTPLAEKLLKDIVRPRVEALAKHFDNARLGEQRLPQLLCYKCEFDHSSRFPATVNLTFGVAHDDEIRNLVLYCDLEILPIFFRFSPHQQTVLPLEHVDEALAGAWVDQRILEFVDTYLQLEKLDQYQQLTLVTDPVCRIRIRGALAATRQEYFGVTYFFCSQECFATFAAAPHQYASGKVA